MISVLFDRGMASHAAIQVLHGFPMAYPFNIIWSLPACFPSLWLFLPLLLPTQVSHPVSDHDTALSGFPRQSPPWHLSTTPQNKDGLIELLFITPFQGPHSPFTSCRFVSCISLQGTCFRDSKPHLSLLAVLLNTNWVLYYQGRKDPMMHEIPICIRSQIHLQLQRCNGLTYYILHCYVMKIWPLLFLGQV